MPAERIDPMQEEGTQCVVVLQVLRENHELRWSRRELEQELHDVDPAAIGVAIECLREQGVVQTEGERVWASPCALHLDALGFISI
jgi:hypothetical protein